jgi:hypothetical protein
MATSKVSLKNDQAASKVSAETDTQLLDKLAKLWVADNTRSLELRLQTGRLLNDRLGQPIKRQPRGPSVMKDAAETLCIAQSELNRMRWFEYFSKDEASCWSDVPPGRHSWTKFKERLPALIASLKGKEKRSSFSGDRRSTVLVDGLLRSISSVTTKFRTDSLTVVGTKREELIVGLRDLASAVFNVTGVRFQVVETEEGTTGNQSLIEASVNAGCETSRLALSQCLSDTAAV